LTANQTPAPEGAHAVAMKVPMMSTVALDTSHIDELQREADIAARLQHSNICDLVGVAPEFVVGGSLVFVFKSQIRYCQGRRRGGEINERQKKGLLYSVMDTLYTHSGNDTNDKEVNVNVKLATRACCW
jgi:hypothetical protein